MAYACLIRWQKLWPETTHDPEAFGIPLIDSQCTSKHDGYTTASTSRLQLALAKVALLLGVTFDVGSKVGGWPTPLLSSYLSSSHPESDLIKSDLIGSSLTQSNQIKPIQAP